jgi:hypothetical protein
MIFRAARRSQDNDNLGIFLPTALGFHRIAPVEYSPLLAVATGLLELGAGIWVILGLRFGRKRILIPQALIFILLAGYQFAEVAVCGHVENQDWTQLAYLDITWLPPLGMWLCAQLCSPKHRWLKIAALADFGLALAFSVWIFSNPQPITKSVCQLVIARYFPVAVFDIAYGLFYQVSLLLTIFGAAAGMAFSENGVLRKHLANLQTGLLGFLLPAVAVRIFIDEPDGLMPSVMCHFAVVLAVSIFVSVLRERRTVLKPR